MELRDYIRIVRRRWLLILGTTMVSLAIAALITAQQTKQYVSTARVFVSTTASSSNDALQGSQFSEQRVASYADLVSSPDLAQKVIDDLGLHLSANTLSKMIDATVVPDTVVLKVDVTGPSPRLDQRINAGVLTQLQDIVTKLETPPGKQAPLLKATVVETPRLPSTPVSPHPSRNLALGLLIGLILGLALAVIRELLDTTVKGIDDVPSLRDTPVLSALAYDGDVARKPLISSLPSQAPRVEAFRVLRTNLSFVHVDQQHKIFVVTSSMPGEGKSTTAVNVAIALAESGQRVLLIDGDLRRPQVASMLNLEGTVGLTTVLIGQLDLDDVLQQAAASGLFVLTSGHLPPNPAELLQSRAMSDLLAEVRSRFDVVVIDSPPLLPVTDAAVMAAQTDGAVLVVRSGKTTKEQLGDAVDRLHSVDSAPLGVIFNMVPTGLSGRYGYGYGQTEQSRGGTGKGPRGSTNGSKPDSDLVQESQPTGANT